MAIVRMLHIKENGATCANLRKVIFYTANPQKTEGGFWVGGTAGSSPEAAYRQMMDTKTSWDKLDGRQGYHFIISFKPGECDAATAYNVAQDFCEKYFRSRFEYILSVHTDKKHMHAHVVFNSVSTLDGYKYHYANGDWAKDVQPILDAVAQSYGLSKLEYDKKKKTGKGYGKWKEEKEAETGTKSLSQSDRVRADIDDAIRRADSYEEFLNLLREKYTVRTGHSRKLDSDYIALKSDEMERARRNYVLGEEYSVPRIHERILQKMAAPDQSSPDHPEAFPETQDSPEELPTREKSQKSKTIFVGVRETLILVTTYKGQGLPQTSDPQVRRYLYNYWQVKNMERRLGGGNNRRANRKADERLADLHYLIEMQFGSGKEMDERLETLDREKRELRRERRKISQSINQSTEALDGRREKLTAALAADPESPDAENWKEELSQIEERKQAIQKERKEKNEEMKKQDRGIRKEQERIRRIKEL